MSNEKGRQATVAQMESGEGYGKTPISAPPAYGQQSYPPQQYPQGAQGYYGPQYPPAPVAVVMTRNLEAGQRYQSTFIGSIIVTLLCCWPIGIFAISNAKKAKDFAEMGQTELAEEHGSKARRYIALSIVGGIICIGIIVAVTVVRVLAIQEQYKDLYD